MSNSLLKHLPGYYQTSLVMTELTDSDDKELQSFKTSVVNTLNQFFIDTADFTLERWEKELGIPVNNTKTADFRRSVIKSKLRGSGTVKVNLIKNVSESYSNGEVDVIEDNAAYSFTIKFVGEKGIPPNLDDLKTTIEDIKPAHLAVSYVFTYNTHDYLRQFTNADLSLYTHSELREVI